MSLDTAFEEQFRIYFEKKSRAVADPDKLDDKGNDALHIEAHEEYVKTVKLAANAIFAESHIIDIYTVGEQVRRAVEKMQLPLEKIGDGLMGISVTGKLAEDIMRWPNLEKYDPQKVRDILSGIDLSELGDF